MSEESESAAATETTWVATREGKQYGPYTIDGLLAALESEEIFARTLIRESNGSQWVPVENVLAEIRRKQPITVKFDEGTPLDVLCGGQWLGPLERREIQRLMTLRCFSGHELSRDENGRFEPLSQYFELTDWTAAKGGSSPESSIRYSFLESAIWFFRVVAVISLILSVLVFATPARDTITASVMLIASALGLLLQAELVRILVDIAIAIRKQLWLNERRGR